MIHSDNGIDKDQEDADLVAALIQFSSATPTSNASWSSSTGSSSLWSEALSANKTFSFGGVTTAFSQGTTQNSVDASPALSSFPPANPSSSSSAAASTESSSSSIHPQSPFHSGSDQVGFALANNSFVVEGKKDFAHTLAVDPQRIAASERTVRLAQMWPQDSSMQQLVLEVIRIAANVRTGYILSVPAAIALAGCGVRLAVYLLDRSTRSSSSSDAANQPLDLRTLFDDLRQTTLKHFKTGGWGAVKSIPREIMEHWWAMARKREPPIPASFDCEAEQAVCGAYVAEWIRILIQCMGSVRSSYSLLSLLTLDLVLMPGGYPPPTVLSGDVFDTFVRLKCEFLPNLTELMLLETVQLRLSPAACMGYSRFIIPPKDREQHAVTDDFAAMLILDSDSWYHHPDAMRQVAEQLVRGEFQPHAPSNLLNQFKIRPTRVEGLLPRGEIKDFCGEHLLGRSASRLHFTSTDAAGRDWHFTLLFDHEERRGWLYDGPTAFVDFLPATETQGLRVVVHSTLSDIWTRFSHSEEVPQHEDHPIGREWSAQAFGDLALQLQPLVDFRLWGFSRYEDMHTPEARCRFQACMIDASLKADDMPLLPAVILDLIAEYHTLSLPYIDLEKQQLLLNMKNVE